MQQTENLKQYISENGKYNSIILLGPTACGKTGLGVKLADWFCQNGVACEILGADSRQVYKGLDIGSGKDLCEFILDKNLESERKIEYHLIDIVDVGQEYNVFNYQKDFYDVFSSMLEKKKLPFVVGGTGMYIDSVVRSYKMGSVPTNIQLRNELQGKSLQELTQILLDLKSKNNSSLHNSTDTTEHHRVLRAIEIEKWNLDHGTNSDFSEETDIPSVKPLILGVTFERSVLRARITQRLKERMENGLIEEVERIHNEGATWERLERLGLEYKFVSMYLEGKIKTKEELFEKLDTAIHQFAKRQETWFRGMERKGVKINWLSKDESRYEMAQKIILDEISK